MASALALTRASWPHERRLTMAVRWPRRVRSHLHRRCRSAAAQERGLRCRGQKQGKGVGTRLRVVRVLVVRLHPTQRRWLEPRRALPPSWRERECMLHVAILLLQRLHLQPPEAACSWRAVLFSRVAACRHVRNAVVRCVVAYAVACSAAQWGAAACSGVWRPAVQRSCVWCRVAVCSWHVATCSGRVAVHGEMQPACRYV